MSIRATSWAFDQRIGNSGAKLVLLCLADHAGFDNTCFPSIALIARKTELSSRTIKRMLDFLEQQGLVTRTKRASSTGSSATNLYTLHLPIGGDSVTPSQSATVTPGGVSVSPRGDSRVTPITKNRNLTVNEPKAFKKIQEALDRAHRRVHLPNGSPEFEAWRQLSPAEKARTKPIDAKDGGVHAFPWRNMEHKRAS